jgi:hypothetical protein
MDLRSLLESSEPAFPARARAVLLPLLQDEGTEWGWDTVRKGEKKNTEKETGGEEIEKKKEETEVRDDPKWGEGPIDEPRRGIDERARGAAWARKTRIGFSGGAFLPFGAKEESFGTGGTGGIVLGFGLPPLIEGITITSELRIQVALTESGEQSGGFDVQSTLLLFKKDFLFHFFPYEKAFNLFAFVGVGAGYEMTSADPTDPASALDGDSESAFWFLADGGFGAWVNLGGPVDLVLKLEFNFIPVTENVPFFVVGEGGLQVKF